MNNKGLLINKTLVVTSSFLITVQATCESNKVAEKNLCEGVLAGITKGAFLVYFPGEKKENETY